MTRNCATGLSISKGCAEYATTTSPIPPSPSCSKSSTPARRATALTITFTTAENTRISIAAGESPAALQQRDHDRRHVRPRQGEGSLALVGSRAAPRRRNRVQEIHLCWRPHVLDRQSRGAQCSQAGGGRRQDRLRWIRRVRNVRHGLERHRQTQADRQLAVRIQRARHHSLPYLLSRDLRCCPSPVAEPDCRDA